jgi:hypothetical protein
MTNSKQGKVPSTDGCPGLEPRGGRVFGESPVKRPISGGKHPPVRADASETANLAQASNNPAADH